VLYDTFRQLPSWTLTPKRTNPAAWMKRLENGESLCSLLDVYVERWKSFMAMAFLALDPPSLHTAPFPHVTFPLPMSPSHWQPPWASHHSPSVTQLHITSMRWENARRSLISVCLIEHNPPKI
jgi:hypothetical protein